MNGDQLMRERFRVLYAARIDADLSTDESARRLLLGEAARRRLTPSPQNLHTLLVEAMNHYVRDLDRVP